MALAVLAAWQVPPRMDWNRYRGAIAAFASSRMGRQVSIDGQVRLLLLPDTVLVADKVRLADRGDGISATIGALRLRIALAPLLRGRLVPRRLELDDPTIRLPWPLPRGAAQVPTGVAGGFTASVEGGALHLGGVVLTGIAAGVQTDPDTGAFAAQGSARLGAMPCNFTALIGAPASDGVSTLSVTLDGRAGLQGTGGSLRGRVEPGGLVAGELALRGPDLSRLLAVPPLPWRLQGAIDAGEARLSAPHLALMLGDSPGEASATLDLGRAPALDAVVKIGRLTLDGWPRDALAPSPGLAVHVDVAATASPLLGGTVRDTHVVLGMDGRGATLTADGVLPGGSAAHLAGTVRPSADGGALDGAFTLKTPDAPLLLAWAGKLAPALLGALPALPVQADAAGSIALGHGRARITGLVLHQGGSTATGSIGFSGGIRPAIDADLAIDHLAWAGASAPGWWDAAKNLGQVNAPFAGVDAAFNLSVGSFSAGQHVLSHVLAQGKAGAAGLSFTRLSADLPGTHIDASGGIGPDGAIQGARLDLAAANAAALKLPFSLPPGLWTGPLHVAVTASGPPQAISGQLRGDLGDLRAEAEATLNTQAPLASATVTLRHPGAPRFLGLIGVLGAGAWIGPGSVAFSAHLTGAPGQVAVTDFSLAAGALRLNGQVGAVLSAAAPVLTGRLDAPALTLPALAGGPDTPLPLWLLQGWDGQLVLSARQVSAGSWPLAANARATLTVAHGGALLDGAEADIAGGHFAGQAAADTTLPLPVLALEGNLDGAAPTDLPALPGLAWQGGKAGLSGDITAYGNSPAALLATLGGAVQGQLAGVAVQGIDLPALTHLLLAHGPRLRSALPAALGSGQSGPLDGSFAATFDNGAMTLHGAAFSGAAGTIDVEGGIDLPTRSPDLLIRVRPAVPRPPALVVRLEGTRRLVNAQAGLAWGARPKP